MSVGAVSNHPTPFERASEESAPVRHLALVLCFHISQGFSVLLRVLCPHVPGQCYVVATAVGTLFWLPIKNDRENRSSENLHQDVIFLLEYQ